VLIRLYAPEPFRVTPVAHVSNLEEIVDVVYVPEIDAVVAGHVKITVDGNPVVSRFVHDMELDASAIKPRGSLKQPTR
jgi:hypothetical protein